MSVDIIQYTRIEKEVIIIEDRRPYYYERSPYEDIALMTFIARQITAIVANLLQIGKLAESKNNKLFKDMKSKRVRSGSIKVKEPTRIRVE